MENASKALIIAGSVLIAILVISLGLLIFKSTSGTTAQTQDLGKEIYGAEIATLINKVTEQNERNNVSKDENGYYIDNGTNSIKIDLKMITVEKTYPMELIYKNDVTNFVKNFNVILFKCTNIEYHKETGKVSKLIFEQIEK